MSRYEYRVVPAPAKGLKAKGIRTPEARFSHALQSLMNKMGQDGWEYQRAETLPSTERSGLASTTTQWRNVLVFRRLMSAAIDAFQPQVQPIASPAEPPAPPPVTAVTKPATPEDNASQSKGATQMIRDNGVEDISDVSGMTNSLQKLAMARKSGKSDA